jgi:hypothetical protein
MLGSGSPGARKSKFCILCTCGQIPVLIAAVRHAIEGLGNLTEWVSVIRTKEAFKAPRVRSPGYPALSGLPVLYHVTSRP